MTPIDDRSHCDALLDSGTLASRLATLIATADGEHLVLGENHAAEKLLGRQRTELENRPLVSFFGSALGPRAKEVLDRVARTGTSDFAQLAVTTADGHVIPCVAVVCRAPSDAGSAALRVQLVDTSRAPGDDERHGVPAANEMKEVNEALLLSGLREQDLAEEAQRQNEELARALDDRKRAEEALREQDRRKTEFLAMLSHELRNPLAPITQSLHNLEHAPAGGDQAARAHAVLRRQVGQLTRLVDDLLEITRVTQQKIRIHPQRRELNELLRRTLEDHRAEFEQKQVKLDLEASPSPVYVMGDWARLVQVFGNLLQNSAKFTGVGGRTTVSVSVDPAERRAIVRVADDGVGITPEVIDRLFEPFVQADVALARSQGGLGLGLALVKGLVELHGGSVTAQSEGAGKGAQFVVRLPLDTGESEPASEQGEDRAAPVHSRRVLIIEDNVDAADTLRDALALSGHDVEVAYSGPEGLTKARSFLPDVVLCDVGLPGMDGYDVARALRADSELRGASLVALTGYALPDDRQRAADAGFDRHLAKPPNLEMLKSLICTLPARDAQGPRTRR